MFRRFLLFALLLSPLLGLSCLDSVPTGPSGTVGLGVGQNAPPLEGVDMEGNVQRLADYRGKVVVVDFWATWCGPCRAMIPHEKSLAKRMTGRPFAFLGISADRSRGDLAQFLREDSLPWPNVFDESRRLVRDWQIEYFPSIFVIDSKGVIRYRDLNGARLERAVEKLVAEAEGK